MPSNYEKIVYRYIADFERAINNSSTAEATPELSFRPYLHTFFSELCAEINQEIEIVFEPKVQHNSGRPDWRFYNNSSLGIYGYVEAKAFSETAISIDKHNPQITKYANLGYNLILTDGFEFCFFWKDMPGVCRASLLIGGKQQSQNTWSSLRVNTSLENEFRKFFKDATFRRCNEESLIVEVAKRASQLALCVEDLAEAPIDSGSDKTENDVIKTLHELKTLVENHHDPNLSEPHEFGKFVSQVLIFCLFYAHRILRDENDTPKDRYKKLGEFWLTKKYEEFCAPLRPFRALANQLSSYLEKNSQLRTWYEDCRLLLAHVKLDESQQALPDYHILYEKFFTEFDKQAKFDFGVWFSPKPLVYFATRLVSCIVDKEFNIDLFKKNNKLIDPCCGTGTFIEELFLMGGNKSSEPEIIGFEILPAPYALAHYRMIHIQNGAYPKNLTIALTDTLSDELENDLEIDESKQNLIQAEQLIAHEKSTPPLTLIIGNPPSVDSRESGSRYSIINELLDDFRPPEEKRTSRQNIQKQTRNDFLRFVRWAANKLEHNSKGVLAFILPLSLGEHGSYKAARKALCALFSSIYVLEIDSDSRRRIPAASMFGTQQGRMLLIGIVKPRENQDTITHVRYASISSLKLNDKIAFLSLKRNTAEYVALFKKVEINTTSYSFLPSSKYDDSLYDYFWPLYSSEENTNDGIFDRHCSLIKLAPSSMLVHVKKESLIRRSKDISNAKLSYDDILERWYKGQDKPPHKDKFTNPLRLAIAQEAKTSFKSIRKYSFRPFLESFVLLSEKVLFALRETKGGGTRARPEVITAFNNSKTIGIAIAPAPKDLSGGLTRFASFCWYPADNDLCSRGNAHIFCNLFPDYKKGKDWKAKPNNNVSDLLITTFDDKDGAKTVFYVYAILCSEKYLKEFNGALFKVADKDSPPRIPIIKSKKNFDELSQLGKQLAELEKESDTLALSTQLNKQIKKYNDEFQLGYYTLNEKDDKIALFNTDKQMKIEIDSIPKETLTFQIAGYNVIQQWLKFHSYRYTRISFTKKDYEDLLRLLQRIINQKEIIGKIDAIVSEILNGDIALMNLS